MLMVKLKVPFPKSCQFVSGLIGADSTLYANTCNGFLIQVKLWSLTTPGEVQVVTSRHVLKKEHLVSIQRYVDTANVESGGMVSVKTIQAFLAREYQRRYNRSAIYYALRVRLGYVYKKPWDLRVAMTPMRQACQCKHWLQRDLALKLEREGKVVVYYMDESYIHQNHFPEGAWFHPDRPAGKGQRLIIANAISLLGLAEVDGERPTPGELDSSVYPTSEMVYRAKSSRGDYHDNFDTDNFMMWMDRRMVPAFRAKHGDEKTLVLIMDNAP